jgi:hypothetical protein
MSGDALVWFAIWNPGRDLAIAIDIGPDEIELCEWPLRSGRGDSFAGPFPSQQQAESFAVERLATERGRLDRAADQGPGGQAREGHFSARACG